MGNIFLSQRRRTLYICDFMEKCRRRPYPLSHILPTHILWEKCTWDTYPWWNLRPSYKHKHAQLISEMRHNKGTLTAALPLLLLRIQMTLCLQAYDCTSPDTKYAEVSLKEVGSCLQVGKHYENPKSAEVQVMRKIRSNNFKSKWCRVKVDIGTYFRGCKLHYHM